MARRTQPLSGSDLKSFRHNVSILKKKGLISKTDARAAQPYWIRGGERLDKLVSKYDDVLSGKAAAVEVSNTQLRQYKKAGYETIKGRVIIPHAITESVKVSSTGHIKVQNSVKPSTGIKRVEIPVPFHDLEQWVKDARAQAEQLDSLKGGGKRYWAYKFYGHNSYATYSDLDLLFEELSIGTASGLNLLDKSRESTHKQQNEIYQNLTLFSIPGPDSWPKFEKSSKHKYNAKARKKYLKRTANTPVGERRKEKDAERKRQERAAMSDTERKRYNAKGRKRAKKSAKKKR